MSDPREAQRETDLHAFFVARSEFATAFVAVPDAALQYRGASDEYALSGIVVSATDASLRVRIGTLRALPGSLTLRNLGRPLTLAVPSYATVERGEHGSSTHLATAKRGERVIVWTEPADVTADAEAGKDGIISAARIVLPAT